MKRGFYKKWLLVVSLVLVMAAFSAEHGFQWLLGKSAGGNVANDVQSSVVAGLAFKNAGAQVQAEQVLSWVKSKQDAAGCFPAGGCKIKDTVFGYWLLHTFGEDTSKVDAWLRSSLSSTAASGNWYLQVATTSNGSCKVAYDKSGQSKSVNVVVDNGRFPLCSGTTFFDVNNCLEPNLLSSSPVLSLNIDCSLLGSAIISTLFQSGNTFYLLDEASTSQATVVLNNGCFGKTAKSSCDVDASLYAAWLLSEVGSSLAINPWLEANYQSSRVVDNALLSVITQKQLYLDQLEVLQKADGSFGPVYDTAVAVYALKKAGNTVEFQKAVDWLKSQQKADGSWNNKELDSAMVLFAAFGDTQVPSSGGSDYIPPVSGDDEVCGNYLCEANENPVSCPTDCASADDSCNNDGVCDSFLGETSVSCSNDCVASDDGFSDDVESAPVCGDEAVNSPDEECDGADDASCPGLCNADCSCGSEGSSWGWLIVLLIVLLVGVAGYYWYSHLKKPAVPPKNVQKPSFGIPASAQVGRQSPQVELRDAKPVRSKVDDDLDKALEEAKRLFGKK